MGKQERVLTSSRCDMRSSGGVSCSETSSRTKLALGVKGIRGKGRGNVALFNFRASGVTETEESGWETKDEGFKSSSLFLSLSLEGSCLIHSSRRDFGIRPAGLFCVWCWQL